MKRAGLIITLVMAVGIAGILSGYSKENSKKDEKSIALTEVPKVVMDTALKTINGIKLTQAKVEKKKGYLVYELKGNLGDKVYEIEVKQDGTLLEAELEDDGMKKDKKKKNADNTDKK